ncbi:VOC family protein [Acetobacter orleanensis]|uniref:Drug:proton antiporter n=1 Tax=Acetobacter orleanensis TaxID=104099 RepID=A0A4Y3TND6_9PROT|nr:VOC family protein [Acetobacter orleanensis]KXV63037.1 drug:proton antiporter [Acetobacter orleanensis]PCD78812.1 drug:proton antiporter [Acetobacter orleanensis]GAN68803.1 glyoxalase/bleomycin resistance protein/dioxygenase [Acetobacter orleanensis JCM 7639]GBR24395.1 lactoylglutathione lyase [Acetobacter orleanensis NRIC 0473]GEB83294.1 drug:proton antiporter [Acetobacter orleanensis]
MTETNILFLYVADAPASAGFYARLLGIEPVEASPTFALLVLPSGLALGLWGKDGVQPAPTAGGGGCEIGFKMSSPAKIDETHAAWLAKGAMIAFPPTDLGFGRSFVALDPDGHRLRVYAIAEDM